MKDTNVWEEKNLTDQWMNLLKNADQPNYDIITEIKNVLTKNDLNGISKTNSGIYLIVNNKNNKFYVGGSIDIKDRWYRHKLHLTKQKHHCYKLQNDFNQFGNNAFNYFLIEDVDVSNVLKTEQKYLDFCKENPNNNYNVSYSVESGMTGRTHTEETRKKLREARKHQVSPMKGKKMPDSAKQKLRELNLGCKSPKFGKPLSEETKRKIGEANSRKVRTEEEKRHLSEINKGILNPRYGKPISNETREKMRQSALNRYRKTPQSPIWTMVASGFFSLTFKQ